MKVKRTFLQGKMNKDIDERLLPEGQYPHAENIRVANSDASDIGAIENVKGTEQLTSFALTNATTLGSYADDSNQKIYWFTTSDEKDLVVEYNKANDITTVLLESSNPDGVLNFDKNYLITGVVKIINGDSERDLLVWTDDLNPPRMINIERSKTYGVDGFIEDDISLIKKPPRYAPEVNLTFTSTTLENNLENKFLSFAFRYKYLDGEYSALSSFSNYAFAPNEFDLDYETMENVGMVNSFNAVDINFDTGDKRVTDIQLVYKESNSNNLYIIETFNKENEGWGDDESRSFLFSNSKVYTVLPEDEIFRTFDNVPRKAKALELIGTRLVFGNYVEQYDLTNVYGQDINIDFDLSLTQKDLAGEILTGFISTDTSDDDVYTFDIGDINLVSDTRLTIDISLREVTFEDGSYENAFDFILNSDYTDAAALASDGDFILFIEDIMTGHFTTNFNATPPTDGSVFSISGFSIVSSTPTSISIKAPVITYEIDNGIDPITYEDSSWAYNTETETYFKEVAVDYSVKTNRSYEVGIIYMDEEGRKTTVLTDPDNTIYVPQEFSTYQNKIRANVNHLAPEWADRYKFVVKQNKGDYQTIYTNIFYEDGLFRWVKLEGANKDKVSEGDTLIVKSDLGGVVPDIIKVRVLEITEKEKDFLEDNEDLDGNPIIEESGLYMKIKPVGFDMNTDQATFRTFLNGSHYRYPIRTYTAPYFGDYDSVTDTFTPYSLRAGSTVRIFIQFKAGGKIAYEATYDKSFRVNDDYDSVKDWFDAEVGDLGQFGRDYTWNGVDDIGTNVCGGYGNADSNNRYSGWGFGKFCDEATSEATETAESFFVVPHRKGTSSRNITTNVRFEVRFSEGAVIFETEPEDLTNAPYFETEQTFDIVNGLHQGNIQNQSSGSSAVCDLDFFNCYVQGNGAESYRYKDAFNTNYLNIDLRPTTTSIEKYKEVRRFADLTYSEVYSENTNVNGLNEFNLAKANYKEDIDKKYGFIQKLYARDTDLVVFQEDKVSKVLYGKDLLMNADGTSNITGIDSVLGQQIAYNGEYGISRNPESFSYDGYNLYFSDSKRGSVMRLGRDGLTEISSMGMRTWYKDLFKDAINNKKTGGFDPYHDQYVIHPSDEILSQDISISCGDVINRSNFSGTLQIEVDYGAQIGDAGITFTSNGVPVQYTFEWDGNVYNSGFLGDSSYDAELSALGLPSTSGSGDGTFSFNKTESSPTKAKLTIYAPLCDARFSVTTDCIVSDTINVVSVISNGTEDEGLVMNSRYRWSNSTYISSYRSYTEAFEADGITLFENNAGGEGTGSIPLTDSTVRIEAYKGFTQTGSFEGCDKLGYLITDTVYTEADIDTLLGLATFPTVTEDVATTGDTTNYIEFTFSRPSSEQYLYLIWDYKDRKPVAVNDTFNTPKGTSINYPILDNDTDPEGLPLTITIESEPANGTVVVEADNTITYTHDDSETVSDMFTYSISNGVCTSNLANVYIDIAISCEDDFSYSGSQGTFSFNVSFGTGIGTAGITYDSYTIPDQFEIYWDGNLVATTGGAVSGSADLTFSKTTATPTTATIVVTATNSGTAWQMSGICPE